MAQLPLLHRTMSEDELLRGLIAHGHHYGWMAFHPLPCLSSKGRHLTATQGDPGWPDLVLAHPRGGIIVRELKAERGGWRPGQREWLARLEAAAQVGPVEVGLWKPRDYDDALERLSGAGTWR